MFSTIRQKLRTDFLFAFLLSLVLLPFFYTVGPIAERELNPVLSKGSITHVEKPLNPLDDWITFFIEVKKLRQCNYDHIEWYSGDPNGAYARLTMEVEDKSLHLTKKGDTVVHGPQKVFINETQLRDNTFGITYHKCHFFWLSQSYIYP